MKRKLHFKRLFMKHEKQRSKNKSKTIELHIKDS